VKGTLLRKFAYFHKLLRWVECIEFSLVCCQFSESCWIMCSLGHLVAIVFLSYFTGSVDFAVFPWQTIFSWKFLSGESWDKLSMKLKSNLSKPINRKPSSRSHQKVLIKNSFFTRIRWFSHHHSRLARFEIHTQIFLLKIQEESKRSKKIYKTIFTI
jgi:hypothetical protein